MSQITKNGKSYNTVVIVDALTGLPSSNTGGGGSGGTTTATATVVLLYSVLSAFSGASVGDIVSNTQIINTEDGSVVSETWTNLTTNLSLATAPTASAISLQSTQPLTNAQLTALLGQQADIAWGGTGNGSLFGLLKAIWTKLTNGEQKTRLVDAAGNTVQTISDGTNTALLVCNGQTLFITSVKNSTTAQLAAGATWNGLIESIFNQPAAQIGLTSNQNGTLVINQYIDAAGTQLESSWSIPVVANTPINRSFVVSGNYLKMSFTNNGAAATTNLNINTTYGNMPANTQLGNAPVGLMELAGTAIDSTGLPVKINQTTHGVTNAVHVGGMGNGEIVPAITASSAYAAGNIVGGLLTFPNMVQAKALSGVLESIAIKVKSTQSAGFVLDLFKAQPSSTFTDKTASAIAAADSFLRIGTYSLTNNDSGLGANSTLYTLDNIGKAITLSGTSLYGVLRTTGTPTFPTTADIQVAVTIMKD